MVRGLFEGWHLVVLLIVVIVLFGAKRLPDAARGVGRSLRILKAEVKDLKDDDAPRTPQAVEGGSIPSVDPVTDPRRDA
ncbi:MAG: Sec-independent protein translocase subunit TatA [Kineosporiaceae bacterium]